MEQPVDRGGVQDPEHYVIRLIVHVAQMVQEFAYAIVGRIAISSWEFEKQSVDVDAEINNSIVVWECFIWFFICFAIQFYLVHFKRNCSYIFGYSVIIYFLYVLFSCIIGNK